MSAIPPPPVLVTESDNCASPYKNAGYFYYHQFLSDRKKIKIVRVYGTADYGKGEVDHVGSMIKVAVRKEVATGQFFIYTDGVVELLNKNSQIISFM